MEEKKIGPSCDENNPNDPHYPDRYFGNYDSKCNWIWDIGRMNTMLVALSKAYKEATKK